MNFKSLPARAIIGAVILGLAVAAHFAVLYSDAVPRKSWNVLQEYLIFFFYLGWLGISELRRLGKQKQVRSIQATILIMVALLLVQPSSPSKVVLMVLVSVVMLFAFVSAIWYRRFSKEDGKQTSSS